MAEQEEKKKYKYIDTDISLNGLITNLEHNARGYVDAQGWDESKIREFNDALSRYEDAIKEGRISSLRLGDLYDTAGELDNGTANWRDKDGKVVTQEEYDKMKGRKRKKLTNDFYPHREVAKYIDTIAKAMYEKTVGISKKSDDAVKFDYSKHGLWSRFIKQLAPSGEGDLDAWLDSDPFDEKTKKRSTTGRATLLSKFIEDYIGKLEDVDFADTIYGDRDSYVSDLRKLQTELGNGVGTVDFQLLNRLGASPEQYRAFFTTEKTYVRPAEPTEEEQETEATRQQNAATAARRNQMDKKYRDAYGKKAYKVWVPKAGATVGVTFENNANDPQKSMQSYINALNKKNIDFSVAALQGSNGQGYAQYITQYGQMNSGAVRPVTQGKWAGWNYIPESLNQSDMSVMIYNPTNNKVTRAFYGDLGTQAMNDYRTIIESLDTYNQNSSKPLFQEGGNVEYEAPESQVEAEMSILDMIAAGGAASNFDAAMKAQSARTQADPKLRQPLKSANNYSKNEFTSTDIVRLGTVASDIAALVDPEPFSALGLGLLSDVGNLYADIKEGYGFWETAGNFAAGVGLSAVGMIPIFGDAVGSGGKVVKTLMRMMPKLNKALIASGLIYTVSNGDDLVKSLSKIGKDGPDNEMTVQDWRNIGTAIQLVLGGANAYRSNKAAKQLKAAGKNDKVVDVVVKDKQTGKKKTLRFGDKTDVQKIKQATSTEDVNAVINQHASFRGKYEVATKQGETVQWFGEGSKKLRPWTWRTKTKTTDFRQSIIESPTDFARIRAAHAEGTHIGNSRATFIGKRPRYAWDREVIHAEPYPEPTRIAGLLPAPKTKMEIARERAAGTNLPSSGETITPPAPTAKPTAKPSTEIKPLDEPVTKPTAPAGVAPAPYTGPVDFASVRAHLRRTAGPQANLHVSHASKHFTKFADSGQPFENIPHSKSGRWIHSQGISDEDMIKIGVWKRGGAIDKARAVRKAEGGLNTGTLNFDTSVEGYLAREKKRRADEYSKMYPGMPNPYLTRDPFKLPVSLNLPELPSLVGIGAGKTTEEPKPTESKFQVDTRYQGFVDAQKRARIEAYRKEHNLPDWMKTPYEMFDRPSVMEAPKLSVPDSPIPSDFGIGKYDKVGDLYVPTTVVPDYGKGYTGQGDDFYTGHEYGTYTGVGEDGNPTYSRSVSLSGIKTHDNGLRSTNLRPGKRAGSGYDYTNAQANTERARTTWQNTTGNREADFMTWAREWMKDPANKGKSQSEMLADYNSIIDSMYTFKRSMATDEYSGANSYRGYKVEGGDADVRAFNQNNRAVYRTANTPKTGVNGYDENTEGINGTSTAQRFIDITPDAVTSFNWTFADDDSQEFRDLFSGLTKDASGRYYVSRTAFDPSRKPWSVPGTPVEPEKPKPEGEKPGTVTEGPGAGGGGGDDGKGKKKPGSGTGWQGAVSSLAPWMYTIGRFGANMIGNKRMLDNAKKMPVRMIGPEEYQRYIGRSLGDEQMGEQGLAQIDHLTSQAVTPDASQYVAARLDGTMQGLNYRQQAFRRSFDIGNQRAEAAWQQEKENGHSRYTTAIANGDSAIQKKISDINAENGYEAAKMGSWNELLGQAETLAWNEFNENREYRDTIDQMSYKNRILSDLNAAGIPATKEEQQMINDIMIGKKARPVDSSDPMYESYQRIQAAINDKITEWAAARKGTHYVPFTPATYSANNGTVYTPTMPNSTLTAKDGTKLEIQKLRNRVKQVEILQKQSAAQLNAFEKEMDRAQKSASQYYRGQERRKKK